MPRKDGTPTKAERQLVERTESNRQFIARMTDEELANAEKDHPLSFDPLWLNDKDGVAELVYAERERRSKKVED